MGVCYIGGYGRLAQWLARFLHTEEVTGSNPVSPILAISHERWNVAQVQVAPPDGTGLSWAIVFYLTKIQTTLEKSQDRRI